MKFTYRVNVALVAFLLGVVAFLSYQSLSEEESMQLSPVNIEARVSFRFQECVDRLAIFALENQTEEAIYIPVHMSFFWNFQEYYDANLHAGMVMIEYKAPGTQDFEDVTLPVLKQPTAFFVVLPHSSIRYGVELQRIEGIYRVRAPYLEVKDAVSSLSKNESGAMVARDAERLNNSWKEVMSDTVVNDCK
jgi:hypothetical protein